LLPLLASTLEAMSMAARPDPLDSRAAGVLEREPRPAPVDRPAVKPKSLWRNARRVWGGENRVVQGRREATYQLVCGRL